MSEALSHIFDQFRYSICHYRTRMEAEMKIWDLDHAVTEESFACQHAQLQKALFDEYDEKTSKQSKILLKRWTWRRCRARLERELQKDFDYFNEFRALREKLQMERQNCSQLQALISKLMAEQKSAESEKQNETEQLINVHRKLKQESKAQQTELRKQIDVLTTMYELATANRLDNLISSIRHRHRDHHIHNACHDAKLVGEIAEIGTHSLHGLSHGIGAVGSVASIAFAGGSAIALRSRCKKREKAAKKAIDAIENGEDEDDKEDDEEDTDYDVDDEEVEEKKEEDK